MRETLYRGKEIKTGKWVYGGFHEHKPSITAIGKQPETEALIIADSDADWDMPVPIKAYVVEKKTVGEYTGLTDKNGVKIFEGDIVEYKTLRLLVRFAEEYGCFTVDDKFWISAHSEFRIIGNVHDTPELLDRERD
jgi:uncharacterized phage protein (TIGR01671 family)